MSMVGTAIFHNPSNKETIIENLLQKRNLKRMHFIQNKICVMQQGCTMLVRFPLHKVRQIFSADDVAMTVQAKLQPL